MRLKWERFWRKCTDELRIGQRCSFPITFPVKMNPRFMGRDEPTCLSFGQPGWPLFLLRTTGHRPMPSDAFVLKGGKKYGPFSPSQLKQLAATGEITPEDLIKRGQDGLPVPARTIAGLAEAFNEAANQPPAPSQPPVQSGDTAWLSEVLTTENEVNPTAPVPKKTEPRAERAIDAPKKRSEPSWLTTERVPVGFDPYHVWLGIPKGMRPPTHYQLLRIPSGEKADEVIEAATERQSEYVRKCRVGEYTKLADRILYEIEEAKLCLLNPRLRKEYDEKLAEGKPKPAKKRVLPPPSKVVGEGNEIVRSYFGIVSILLAAFIIMAVATFMLPWKRVIFSKSKDEAEVANVPAPPAVAQPGALPVANAANAPQKPRPPAKAINAGNPVQPRGLAVKGTPPVSNPTANRVEVAFTDQVRDATRRAQKFLTGVQKHDGSFGGLGFENPRRILYTTGVTSLAVFALLESGMSKDDPAIAHALDFLRTCPLPDSTYEVSTMLLALVSAHDWERDRTPISTLADKLRDCQTTKGKYAGTWNYGRGKLGGGHEDNCNTGFAIAGLHAATEAGVRVQLRTWQLTADHLIRHQNSDGGWGYHDGDRSTGSMTCSGIASLLNCSQHLTSPNAHGTLQSGQKKAAERSQAVKRGIDWLGEHFTVQENPGHGTTWVLFYLFEVARAGHLSGQQFFGPHDWHREEVGRLIEVQDRRNGNLNAIITANANDWDKIVATSFGLLALSEH